MANRIERSANAPRKDKNAARASAAGAFKVISFKSAKVWEAWLAENHAASVGVWLRFFKKSSGVGSITHDEALDEALCYGWIDGQIQKHDDKSWLQKFTPRRARSIWSKRNIEHVARLTNAKKMKPAGLRQVEAAKADGRWEMAYDSPSNMQVPKDFLERLAENKKAETFFKSLTRANTYAIGWRLQTAKKPETREKRIKAILQMLAKGQKFHP
ncbi:MAG TPA: YdeI/OmpD-associated family protein [Candidatus Acidoferrales bacterium]|nr:YdeI/OmpD-associated family protein [Candidatus Acidoferrales bacterium]